MKIRVVEFYKEYFSDDGHLLNFIQAQNIETDKFWFFEKRSDKMFLSKSDVLISEFKCLLLLLSNIQGFRQRKVIGLGGHYSLMLIARILGPFMGSGFHLYLYNYFLHSMGNKKGIKILLSFLLNTRYTTLIVQSPDELKYFEKMSKNKVFFIPYCENPGYGLNNSVSVEGKYLFTGGYTNRDYRLILECARIHPQLKFVLVVSRSNKDIRDKNIPSNVIIFEEIKKDVFNSLMHNALGVIIPLKENVGASGQMLCLGAMKMSKAIIYCDISSINYYFKHGDGDECGIPYSLGEIDSLNKGVRKLLAGEIDPDEMGRKAFYYYLANYTIEKRNEKLLELIIKS